MDPSILYHARGKESFSGCIWNEYSKVRFDNLKIPCAALQEGSLRDELRVPISSMLWFTSGNLQVCFWWLSESVKSLRVTKPGMGGDGGRGKELQEGGLNTPRCASRCTLGIRFHA